MIDAYTDIKYRHLYGDGSIPRPQPSDFATHYFNGKTNGIYVDIGANDGVTWSNSLTFEINYHWKGICIEPHPKAFAKLINNRKSINLNIAICDTNNELDFMSIEGHAEMLSGLITKYNTHHIQRIQKETQQYGDKVTTLKIKCKTLTDVLREHNIQHVDYLSIDTEGGETSVIEGIDFSKNSFDLISLECNYDPEPLHNLMNKRGFIFLQKICGDNFYKFKHF
jgi:FkbM family methyltransferase